MEFHKMCYLLLAGIEMNIVGFLTALMMIGVAAACRAHK